MEQEQLSYFFLLGNQDISLNIIRAINQSHVQMFRGEGSPPVFHVVRVIEVQVPSVLERGLTLSLSTESRREAPEAQKSRSIF